jgi:hypothetical protein
MLCRVSSTEDGIEVSRESRQDRSPFRVWILRGGARVEEIGLREFDVERVVGDEIFCGGTLVSQRAPSNSIGDGPWKQLRIDFGSFVDRFVWVVLLSGVSLVSPSSLHISSLLVSSSPFFAKCMFSVPVVKH